MAGVVRFMVTNYVQQPATVITASSEQSGTSKSWLKDQLLSKSWRSKTGWNIAGGFNNKLDFNRGGVKVATVAEGNYATAAALATAIVAALEAVDATPVWACTYSSTTHKFTISSDLAFTLLFGTGANIGTGIGNDLGWTISDTGSATSQLAPNVAYKSREWLKIDLGSAQSVKAGIITGFNFGADPTIALQGNSTDAWSSPGVSVVLAGDATIRLQYLDASFRWWRILINDVGYNTLGYSEIGIWYVGTYSQPSVCYSIGFAKKWEELSQVSVALSGAHFQDERPRRPVWSMMWSEVLEADRALLAAAFAAAPKGRNIFLSFDATTPANTAYGCIMEGVGEVLTAGLYYDVPVPAFAGALG